MALNLAELQQKADRVIHNADEFVRKWIEFISAPAGNVTLEYYDQNGNLQTVSFPNRNKLVQDFIANAGSVMTKTFYVDQTNGSDSNDGSQNAPFKTLQKAVNSVPVGGKAIIYIVGSYLLAPSTDMVSFSDRDIRLFPVDSTSQLIIDREGGTTAPFYCERSFVVFRVPLEVRNTGGTTPQIIIRASFNSNIHFRGDANNNNMPLVIGDYCTLIGSEGFYAAQILNRDITTGTGSYIAYLAAGAVLYIANSVTLNGATPSSANIK